jgi:hypothetical protein
MDIIETRAKAHEMLPGHMRALQTSLFAEEEL